MFSKQNRMQSCALAVLCCVEFVAGSTVSNVQIQPLAPTTRRPNVHSRNISESPPVCEQPDYQLFYYQTIKRHFVYANETYCNISELNEKTGFTFRHTTILLTFHCYGVSSSSLWNSMFYTDWRRQIIASVQIENCLLASISRNAFKGLSLLKNLHIEAGFDIIRGDLCNHTLEGKHLEEIKADETVCSSYLWYPPGIFSPLKELEFLTLNKLKLNNSIWEQIEGLRKLKRLFMQGNSISILDKDIVSKLSQLETLDLSNNGIKTISSGSFSKTRSSLYLLNLSQNKISTIADDAFDGLVELQKLNIKGNQITRLNSPMFQSLQILEYLTAAKNNITAIEKEAFKGMRSLLHLDLSRNLIESLPTDTFEHLMSLHELHLSENYINAVHSDTFIPRGNLTLLDISFNNISTIKYEDHGGPLSSTLEKLIIHNNHMTTTAGWLTHSAFPSLKVLDISHNELHERTTTTAWPESLKHVDISENDIVGLKIIISERLGIKTSLTQLNASSNRITDIVIIDEMNLAENRLIKLYIGNNPFHCDCNLVWLQELITLHSSSTNSYAIQDSSKLFCQTLLRHEPGFMKDIKPENFLCEYNVSCPEKCTCYQNERSSDVNIVDCKDNNITVISGDISDSCTVLDLSGNAIDKLEPGSFDRLSQLGELLMNSSQIENIEAGAFKNLSDLIKLDLANNELTTVETEMFEGLERLEVLDLSFNRINRIRKGSLQPMKALKQLDLRNNQLKTISNSEFQFLSQMQYVQLARNPWSCDCAYVALMKQFMINNSKNIEDFYEVTCEYYDSETRKTKTHPLFVHNKPDFCVNEAVDNETSDSVTIIVLSIVLSVIVIGLIAFILAFKHRKFLQIWCFVKFGWKCHRVSGNDRNKEDRHYDAFVSYSGLDCDFIADELVPRLEEPKNGSKGYKLCVHDRDFPAGGSTAETIIDVIENSKRVIVVLSNNYLRSRWCKYEFEQAHYQLVQEGKNRIIMILLEEVDPDLMSTEIRNYTMTRTYLKYKDTRLWAKIQHAMPVAGTHNCIGNLEQDTNSDTVEFIAMDHM